MTTTPEYFLGKIEAKYSTHDQIGNNRALMQRLANIMSEIDNDPEMPDLSFAYNQHYILVEKLGLPSDTKICSFDFITKKHRLFFNIDADEFYYNFEHSEPVDTASVTHFGTNTPPWPFYNMNIKRFERQEVINRKDNFYIQMIKEIYHFLVN